MKKQYIIGALVLLVVTLSCNNPTEVTVVNPTDASLAGKVLPLGIGAVVNAIQGTEIKTDSCDEDGNYQIDGLLAGTCLLEVSANNFGTYHGTITLTPGGISQVNDITLGKYPFPIRSVSPSLQSQWNSITTSVAISFSSSMDTSSVAEAFSITPATDGIFLWSSDNSYCTFKPTMPLKAGTAYTVSMDTSAITTDDRKMEFSFSYTFSTEPFRVANSNPALPVTGWQLSQQPYFYFSAPADAGSVEEAVSVTPAIGVDFVWSGQYMYLKPKTGYWGSSTEYTITLSDSAKDAWGNNLALPYTMTFTTAAAAVNSVSPPDGQTNVSPSSNISLFFNTRVNKDSVEKAFSCRDSLDSLIYGTFSWSSENTYFTFIPSPQLSASMNYTVSIDTTAMDALGGKVSAVSFSFTTDVSRAVFSPTAGSVNVSLSQQASIAFNSPADTRSVEESIYAIPETDLSFSWNGNTVYIRPKSGYWGSDMQYVLVYKETDTIPDDTLATEPEDSLATEPADSLSTHFSTVKATVPSVSPQDGQTSVSMSSQISVSFGTVMNKSSAENAFSCKDSLDSAVTGTFSWSSNNTSLYFTPSRQLKPSMKYIVNFDSTATDELGGSIPGVTSMFKTDIAKATTYPASGSSNISLTQQASLSFNTSVSIQAVENGIYAVPSTDLTFSWSGNTVYIRPATGYWGSNTTYTIIYKDSVAMPGDSLMIKFSTVTANVTSVSPSDGQTNTPFSQTVNVSFSTIMDRPSAETAFSLTDSLGAAIEGTFSWSSSSTSFSFAPSRPLKPSMKYTVILDSTATDAAGGTVLGITASFSTEPFRITSMYPTAGMTGFSLTQQASVSFNSACSTKTVEAAIYTVPACSLGFSWSGNTVYVKPKTNYWGSNTTYSLICRKTVKDINGSALKDSMATDFTTVPAAISQTQPADNQENVSMTATIYVYFTMSMNSAATGQAFSLKDSRDSVVLGNVSFGSNNQYLTFSPSSALRPGTKYTIEIDSTATDINGGKLPPYTSSFTTEYMRITYTNPQNGSNNFNTSSQGYMNFNTAAEVISTENAVSISPETELDFSWSGTYLYFKPRTSYWQSNTKYEVTVDTTARDMFGGPLGRPFSFYFYTSAVRVSSYSPAFQKEGVETSTQISINFNTPMDTTATREAIKLSAPGDVDVPGTVTVSSTSFTFLPDAALDTMTTYTVTVDTTAADEFGIKMPAPWNSMFTTGK